jgi:hypothetical protein
LLKDYSRLKGFLSWTNHAFEESHRSGRVVYPDLVLVNAVSLDCVFVTGTSLPKLEAGALATDF